MANKRSMHTNIAGRVGKVRTQNFLIPLFEAISNSIHSIEVMGAKSGKISVEIQRKPRQQDFQELRGNGELPITGFIITDNGQGFTDANMESFCEADSTYKQKMGGKGIGRFSWLKFFEKAEIDSAYLDGGITKRRQFTFSTQGFSDDEPVDFKGGSYAKITLAPIQVSAESKSKRSRKKFRSATNASK